MATTGENIKRKRLEKKLTQKQLGELCIPQMADSAIRRYESGKANPKIKTLYKIAQGLDCSVHELLGDDVRFDLTNSSKLIAKIAWGKEDLELLAQLEKHMEASQELNIDNKERHHLLTHYYDSLNRVGRDALIEILSNLRLLNDDGKIEAIKRVEELTEIKKYTDK